MLPRIGWISPVRVDSLAKHLLLFLQPLGEVIVYSYATYGLVIEIPNDVDKFDALLLQNNKQTNHPATLCQKLSCSQRMLQRLPHLSPLFLLDEELQSKDLFNFRAPRSKLIIILLLGQLQQS